MFLLPPPHDMVTDSITSSTNVLVYSRVRDGHWGGSWFITPKSTNSPKNIFRKYPNQRFSIRVITKDIFEPPHCHLILNKYLEYNLYIIL